MASDLKAFERLARMASSLSVGRQTEDAVDIHPFDSRNIHPKLPKKVRQLFDDGYYAEATFTAFKFLDKVVARLAASKETGYKLMMAAFDDANPKIKLTPLVETSEIDEQKGYRFVFAGAVQAVRNPRGHEIDVQDDIDQCLDHLTFASLLLRRLEQAKYVL